MKFEIEVKLKVSSVFRRLTGAEEFVENRAYFSTARKKDDWTKNH
ncbi:hypothetical protein [Candidatus Venteria ishoeyi]|nr:hypothetical protein [Candidatus Venteria ishoeyi]MDM8548401.1 hypothetical protein [Candidatus Venteria ishoeyi]